MIMCMQILQVQHQIPFLSIFILCMLAFNGSFVHAFPKEEEKRCDDPNIIIIKFLTCAVLCIPALYTSTRRLQTSSRIGHNIAEPYRIALGRECVYVYSARQICRQALRQSNETVRRIIHITKQQKIIHRNNKLVQSLHCNEYAWHTDGSARTESRRRRR